MRCFWFLVDGSFSLFSREEGPVDMTFKTVYIFFNVEAGYSLHLEKINMQMVPSVMHRPVLQRNPQVTLSIFSLAVTTISRCTLETRESVFFLLLYFSKRSVVYEKENCKAK
jgi:hypothetical protein